MTDDVLAVLIVLALAGLFVFGVGWLLFWLTTPAKVDRPRLRTCQRCGLIMSCIVMVPSCPHGNQPCPLTKPEPRS